MTSLTDSMFEREPEASVTPEIRERVYACITYLSSVCDGAHDLDGQGFSGVHAPFGNMIAALPLDSWTDDVVVAAYELLPVYRMQLGRAGFDVDAIPRPPKSDGAVRRKAAVRAVTAEAGEFVIHFGYDEDVVAAVRLIPGRRWDGATKTWRAPATARAEVAGFIANWNFQPDSAARALLERPATNVVPLRPEVEAPRGRVDVSGPSFEISFPYDRRVREDVASLPNRQWDAVNRVWRVPHYLARRVMALAETWGLEVSDAARAVPLGDGRLPVALSLDGDFVTLRCPHTDAFAHALRRTGWCRWDWRAEAWHAPASRLKDLLAVLDTQDVAVTGRTELEVAVRDADRAREWAESVEDLAPLCELGVELAGWQWAGVRYALERQRTFLSPDVGAGKTRVALAALQAADAFPAVILVPPTLTVNWLRETMAALPGRQVQIVSGHTPRPFGMYPPDIVIGSYDIAHHWRTVLADDLVPRGLIVDESQGIKEWDTRRTKAAIKLSQSVARDGMVLCLTATPVLNHRKEYAPQLAVMGRLDEFGGVEQVRRMDDVADRLRASFCMWRPPREKWQANLPKPRHAPFVIPASELDPDVMADYERAERDLLNYLGDLAAAAAEATGADPFTARWERMMKASSAEQLVRIGVCKRLAARAKLPAIKAWTDNFFTEEHKLLLFGVSVDVLDDLGVHYDCPVIRGDSGTMNAETAVDSPARMRVVDRFQTTDLPLVVLSLKTGGTGLTLTAASHVGFAEMGWTPGTHDQALGRVYGRMNDAHGAIGYYFIAEGTVDERVVSLLARKRSEVDNAIDGVEMDDTGSTSILGDLVLALTRRALGVAE